MANGNSSTSDDDFQSNSPILSQNLIKRNQKIPAGHLLAAWKWRGTPVVEKVKGKQKKLLKPIITIITSLFLTHAESIKVLFESNLGVVDFHPSAECAVMFVSLSDMAEEPPQQYRKRLAGLKAVGRFQEITFFF